MSDAREKIIQAMMSGQAAGADMAPRRQRSWLESLGSTGLGGFSPPLEDFSRAEHKQMADFNTDAMRSGVASAIDPLNIPSAVVGTVSPTIRDHWRAEQDRNFAGNMVGNTIGTAGLFRAIPAASSAGGGIARGGAAGASADVIDTASGNGGFDKQTLYNTMLGAIMSRVKPRIPGAR